MIWRRALPRTCWRGAGRRFADWFAADGVALGNAAMPLIGKVAIQKSANWDPKVYQLTWTPTDAMMGPSGDMGYTWGHFEGHSKDASGNPVTVKGRYITVWKKQADGQWKVVLDAGANEPVPRPGIAASCRRESGKDREQGLGNREQGG